MIDMKNLTLIKNTNWYTLKMVGKNVFSAGTKEVIDTYCKQYKLTYIEKP